jgi:hypothetical protein
MLFRIGLDAVIAGDEEFGFGQLKRSWTLSPMFGARIVTALEPQIGWERVLEQVVPDSVPILRDLHATMKAQAAPQERLDAVRDRIRGLGGIAD